MIPRYTHPEMASIWTDQHKYDGWLKVELAALESMMELGLVPQDDAKAVLSASITLDPERIEEIEQTTKHDIIAFLTHVEEQAGEAARWVHFGMTSSDVLDTAFALQLRDASALLDRDLLALLEVLKRRAEEHKFTPMIGRSHGIHAEPVTFGLVVAGWYEEMQRNLERLRHASEGLRVGMISGAVGTFAHIPPEVEEKTCAKLGLKPDPVTTQVIARDRHAEFFNALALTAAAVERIAIQIRHFQRTEVREVEEFFSKGQKGSSAMPHKRNPIASENLSGQARLVKSYAQAALDNIPLWHERDISHSSVERIIAPDATVTLDYMLRRLTRLVDKMVVYPEAMMDNLNRMRGLVFSQRFLLELAKRGVARQTAYVMVQRNAMRVWQEDGLTLKDALLADTELLGLMPKEEVESLFDMSYHTKHVETIFNRVFKARQD